MRTDSAIFQALGIFGLALNSVTGLALNPDFLRSQAKATSISKNDMHRPCKSRRHENESILGRRRALKGIFGGVVLATVAIPANALDMDSFVNSELESDQKNCDPKRDPKCIPKLTPDQALCKYGQSGDKRAEACANVKKAGGAMPDIKSQGKSLGGAYAM
mmetsp:Transcript_21528/g.31846  ORF Transcript_21528/g.31846 Transcript_21528/m.31846 type:complete len:161 (-) Transcript_21528:2718-3200(-)